MSKRKIDAKLIFKESPSLQIESQDLKDVDLEKCLLLENSPSILVQFHSATGIIICPGAKLYVWECDKMIDEKGLLIKLPPLFPNLPMLDECFTITFEFSEDFTHLAKCHAAVEWFKKRKLDYLLFPPDQTNFSNTKPVTFTCSLPLKKFSTDLNPEQVSAMETILLSGSVLPVVIAGPFGTGKTLLLSQAAEYLVKHSKRCRILICTLTNSTANVYLEHFHRGMPPHGSHKILRLLYKKRNFMPPGNLQKYFLYDPSIKEFKYPTESDAKDYHIIVTTLGLAQELLKLKLTGHFTHIFIDEAAQMTVPEVMMALSLASNTTKVVMAGDHMQVSIATHMCKQLYSNINISLNYIAACALTQ